MTAQGRLTVFAALATALAAICLGSVFDSARWLPAVVFAVVVVAAFSEGARRLALPRLLVPAVGFVGLIVALTFSFAQEEAWLWVVPNREVLATFADLAVAGEQTIRSYAAPVAPAPGVTAIAAAGVGLVAVVVDAVAVTFARPALSGLPLLAVYTVPAAVAPGGVGWGAFALGAGGFLALLLAEARDKVTRWGRPLGAGRSPRDSTSPLAAVGRRVGVGAIGLAVLAPVLIPGVDEGVFGGTGSGLGNGNGSNTVAVLNPILDLGRDLNRPDDREVMRYQTQDEDPAYLRLVVLDDFTGDVWEPSRLRVSKTQTVDRGLARPVGLGDAVSQQEVRTDIEVGDFESRWLPLPYPTQRVEDIEGVWLWDEDTFNVFSVSSSTRDNSYTVTSLEVAPSRAQLRAAGSPARDMDRFLALPKDVPPQILAAAARVTQGAGSRYDAAVALQAWFRDTSVFTYDERAPDGTGFGAIVNFLEDKRGFCVHFASTMAVMARELGIPARVAVGFTPGAETAPGRYSVGTHDLHAWPELYFEGAGWIPFEPTPAVRTGTPPTYTTVIPDPLGGGGPDGVASDPGATNPGSAGPTPGVTTGLGGLDRGGPGNDPAVEQQRDVPWTAVVLVALLLVAAVTPAVARRVVRRRRWADAREPEAVAGAAWEETRDLTLDYGIDLPDSLTPRQFARLLGARADLSPAAHEALERVARAAERAQYAIRVGTIGDLRGDVSTVRDGLVRRSSLRQRVRAALLPASTAALLHRAGERIADFLDAGDRAAATARQRVLPGRRRTNP